MSKVLDRVRSAAIALAIKPGDIYEDCAYHPVVCVEADIEDDSLTGVSLINGSYPRCCSFIHCGVRKLSIEEAWEIRLNDPTDEDARGRIGFDRRWWRE